MKYRLIAVSLYGHYTGFLRHILHDLPVGQLRGLPAQVGKYSALRQQDGPQRDVGENNGQRAGTPWPRRGPMGVKKC